MTILEMQEAIQRAGWQWQEHVFNDSLAEFRDCYVRFSKNDNPHVFQHVPAGQTVSDELLEAKRGEIGWGRYQRQRCWEMAYRHIVTNNCGKEAADAASNT
jgi:hypothetical protein